MSRKPRVRRGQQHRDSAKPWAVYRIGQFGCENSGTMLDTLVAFMDQHPKVGLVGPRILNTDMTLQSSCRRFPNPWNICVQRRVWHASRVPTRCSAASTCCTFGMTKFGPWTCWSGCFWVMRREALDRVGPLDERFYIYAEDVDWCRRCWNAKWEIMFLS